MYENDNKNIPTNEKNNLPRPRYVIISGQTWSNRED